MKITRRQFIQGGAAAFTVTFAAPEFLCDLARAQGARVRNLVILYLGGGNDALSMLIPYNDAAYYSRRPTLAVPAGNVLPIGRDPSNVDLGLHPRLTGLKGIFDAGRLALIQRTGYPNQSRSHFQGTDIWAAANQSASPSGYGWLGRYLDSLPSPVDPLIGWNTTGNTPHVILADHVAVPAISSPSTYAFTSPNGGPTSADAIAERNAMSRMNSHVPINNAQLAFVYGSTTAALNTLDRVATVAAYQPSLTYPNSSFGNALKAVAGSIARGIGTRVFYVTTGGFDTHSGQGVNPTTGAYYRLMANIDDGLTAFYNDLSAQGLLTDTLVLSFSEFGRRISENSTGTANAGTDHGSAACMMALGGLVNGGLYGTAANLAPGTTNATLENNSADIRYETDFRSVYARVIDNWLGASSVAILGADFRKASLTFV